METLAKLGVLARGNQVLQYITLCVRRVLHPVFYGCKSQAGKS
jgi:hypothetical protein